MSKVGIATACLFVLTTVALGVGPPVPVARDWYGDPLPKFAVARLGTTRLRHSGVAQLAFSADGKFLASGGGDVVRVWRVSDGGLVRETNRVDHVSRSGKSLLALKPGAKGLIFHDVLTGKDVLQTNWTPPAEWESPANWFTLASRAAMRGAFLSLAGGEGITLWDLETGKSTGRLEGKFRPLAMTFSTDGKTLLSGDLVDAKVGHIRFWEVATRKMTRDLSAGHGAAHALALSDDGNTLAVAHARLNYFDDSDQTETAVTLRDAKTGKKLRVLCEHGPRTSALAFSPDGRTVAVGRSGSLEWAGTIELYDTATGKRLEPVIGHLDAVVSAAFRPGGGIVTCGRWEARVWSDEGKPLALTDLVMKLPRYTRVVPGGTRVVWQTEEGKVFVRDLKTGKEIGPFGPAGSGKEVLRLNGAGKGLKLWSERLGFHDAAPWKAGLKGEARVDIESGNTAFSADGNLVAQGGYDTPITLYDTATGKALRAFETARKPTSPVLFTPDGKTLVACQRDQTVSLWDVAKGKRRGPVIEHPSGTRNLSARAPVALSPDGKLLATGGAGPESTVRLWDVSTGNELIRLPGHARLGIRTLVFSPDGKRLLSGGRDSTALVWDVPAAVSAGRAAKAGSAGK